ncbi:MAG: host attachment protein [Rhodobacteraceae bacterium]|nr:MAG: host attachment protein [Paracoccaceae bacterium]
MALLAKGIWIIAAGGERALFLENIGTPDKPKLSLHERAESDGTDMELADRPGRMQDTGKQQLSAMEMTDHDQLARDRFAAQVAAKINKLVTKKGIGRLIVVAPPHTLSVLRSEISDAARKTIMAEIDKDLTHHPLEKIGALVAADIDPL